jgi:hypothetical protein
MPFTRGHLMQTARSAPPLGRCWTLAAVAAGESTGSEKVKIVNLDDRVTFRQQFEHNIGPVVLMSTFLVAPDQIDRDHAKACPA